MATQEPTAFPDLNRVLRELVSGAGTILGGSFCGAYLQGSFAVGDADVHSDVDFLIVTNDEVGAAQLAALQAIHGELHDLDVAWAQHLDGSYAPRAALRRPGPDHSPWLYLDNGSRTLVRSDHDDTAVVRWALREHGVVLAGPDPKDLVDPVTADDLRREVLATMRAWSQELRAEPDDRMDNRWRQPYVVLSCCRMLHTLAVGRVTSKRAAGEWAIDTLDPAWAGLVRRALDDRPDPWVRVRQRSDPETVARTWDFLDHALGVADRYADRHGVDPPSGPPGLPG